MAVLLEKLASFLQHQVDFLLPVFFDDAEGFAGEIGVMCIPGAENELKFVALK